MFALLFSLFLSHPFSTRIDKEHVFDVIGKEKHVLVHFYADSCAHCAKFEHAWNELARMYRPLDNFVTATINCDRWNSLCVMFDGSSTPTIEYFAPHEKNGQAYGGEREVLPLVKWVKKMADVTPFTKPGSLLFVTPSEIEELEKESWVLIVADDPRNQHYNHTELRNCEGQRMIELRALSSTHWPKEVENACGTGIDHCIVLTDGKRKFLYEGDVETDKILTFFDSHVSPDL